MEKNYRQIYDEFVDSYKKNVVDGEDVGIIIMHLVQQFATTNVRLTVAETAMSRKHERIIGGTDDNDKPISVSKSDIMLAATHDAKEVRNAKAELKTIEQMINSLKSLQKGILNEYSHVGSM